MGSWQVLTGVGGLKASGTVGTDMWKDMNDDLDHVATHVMLSSFT